jgi:transcriptional regulator with XRE-family HTH domain
MSKLFDKVLAKVSDETKRFVDNSIEIADQIHSILESQNKSQKDLADLMGKSESEISKWLTGTHNFTLKSLSKIEVVLNEKIVLTPLQSRRDFLKMTENAIQVLDAQLTTDYTLVHENRYKSLWRQFKWQLVVSQSKNVAAKKNSETGENNYAMAA